MIWEIDALFSLLFHYEILYGDLNAANTRGYRLWYVRHRSRSPPIQTWGNTAIQSVIGVNQ